MFKVTVTGTYIIGGKISQIDSYEVTFKMAEDRKPEARAIIQNSGMLDEKLRKDKKGFKRWRTCQVINIEEIEGKVDEAEKELEKLLIEATQLACIPIDYKSYANDKMRVGSLEKAIEKKKISIAKAKSRSKGDKKGTLEQANEIIKA